jgi:hypothetical protein
VGQDCLSELWSLLAVLVPTCGTISAPELPGSFVATERGRRCWAAVSGRRGDSRPVSTEDGRQELVLGALRVRAELPDDADDRALGEVPVPVRTDALHRRCPHRARPAAARHKPAATTADRLPATGDPCGERRASARPARSTRDRRPLAYIQSRPAGTADAAAVAMRYRARAGERVQPAGWAP